MAPASSALLTSSSSLKLVKRNHLNVWKLLADDTCSFCPVHLRHDHIHQDHIGLQLGAQLDGGLTVLGFACQFQVIEGFKKVAKPRRTMVWSSTSITRMGLDEGVVIV